MAYHKDRGLTFQFHDDRLQTTNKIFVRLRKFMTMERNNISGWNEDSMINQWSIVYWTILFQTIEERVRRDYSENVVVSLNNNYVQ